MGLPSRISPSGPAVLPEDVATDSEVQLAEGGFEFTGGFTDRTTGQSGASDLGSNVEYTQAMADAGTWYRFGFSADRQIANDVPYWTEPAPASATGVGLFGGTAMPGGFTRMFVFSDTSSEAYSQAVDTGSLQYTAANGSYDFSQCIAGDYVNVRFDLNIVPQVANTTVEVGLIWATRNSSDEVTFTFPLTTNPIFFGEGTVGIPYLSRPIVTAYIASAEDINARALLAIRADNPVLVQPLTTLATVIR